MKLYVFLLGIALPFTTLAQSNYKDGYIIKPNGDTIRGQVDLQEWNLNPEYIDFKSPDNSVQRYKPTDVNEFYVEPEFRYISYTGRISNNHNTFPDVDNSRDTSTRVASVFLKELIGGSRLYLYSLSDKIKSSYFYQETNASLVELNYYRYSYVDPNPDKGLLSGNTLKEEKFYIQQVLNLTKMHPEWGSYTLADFEKLSYRAADLIRVFNKINGNGKVKHSNVKNVQFFAGGGVLITNTKFKTANNIAFSGSSSKPGYKISLGLNVFANPVTQKLFFRTEVTAEFLEAEASRQVLNAISQLVTEQYQIKRTAFALTPQVLYNFYNGKNLKVHAGGGISVSSNIYPKNGFIGQDDERQNGYSLPYSLRNFVVTFPLQIGLQINNKLETAFSYTIPHHLNNGQHSTVKMSTIGLNFRYLFN